MIEDRKVYRPVVLKALRYLALLFLLVATTAQAEECEVNFETTPVGTSQATRSPIDRPIVVAPTAAPFETLQPGSENTTVVPSRPTNTPAPAGTKPCVPSPKIPFPGEILDNGRFDRQDNIVWSFQWTECDSAEMYNLVVSHKDASVPLIDTNVRVPEYEFIRSGGFISDRSREGWEWRVRVLKEGVRTEWSETNVFDVEPVDTDDAYPALVRLIDPAPGDVVSNAFLVTGVAERMTRDSSIWVAIWFDNQLFLWGQARIFESARQEAVVEWQLPVIISDEVQQRNTRAIMVIVADADLHDSFDGLFIRSLGKPVRLDPSALDDFSFVQVDITVSNEAP